MKINGKDYKVPEFTFATMCDLENYGLSLTSINEKPLSAIRAFVALVIGNKEKADEELEQHLINGGDFEDIAKEMMNALSSSGFFRSIAARQEEKIAESETA